MNAISGSPTEMFLRNLLRGLLLRFLFLALMNLWDSVFVKKINELFKIMILSTDRRCRSVNADDTGQSFIFCWFLLFNHSVNCCCFRSGKGTVKTYLDSCDARIFLCPRFILFLIVQVH